MLQLRDTILLPEFSPRNVMADQPSVPPVEAPPRPPVVVKKYANRRLYNTETSSYITLDNLAEMIRAGRDFVVYDAKTGDDITRGVLTQIIVEEESKGSSMLPTNFLRSLIGFYGDSLQGVVPSYLEQAMANFARQQQQMRQVVQQTFSPFIPLGVEEMSRQNMALIERAMTMFNPFHSQTGQQTGHLPGHTETQPAPEQETHPSKEPALAAPAAPELEALRHEVESLRAQLAVAHAELVVGHAKLPEPVAVAPNVLADPPTQGVAGQPGVSQPGVSSADAIPLSVARARTKAARKS
jgi:polyhydroxyalkanoate synthesis repressor PhaR